MHVFFLQCSYAMYADTIGSIASYSEVSYEEIIQALEKVHAYAPSKEVEREYQIPNRQGSESVMTLHDKNLALTLIGGDQLTVARIRGAQRIRGNSETSEQRFEGLLPVAEDWHAKMCFLEVG